MTVEILVLASGSSGNSVLVTSGETSVLVDIGVSALQVRRRLEVFGRAPDEIDAILLTHEHSDHVRGLDVFLRRWGRHGPLATQRGRLASGRQPPNRGNPLPQGQARIDTTEAEVLSQTELIDQGAHIGYVRYDPD